jgi:multidrug resistance efflux pump
MLDISENTLPPHCDRLPLKSRQSSNMPAGHLRFRTFLWILMGVFVLFMFLPWTQTVQAYGKVTTLRPEHRPQVLPSTIAGRIEKWYVMEGQAVRKGDTIVHISEVKSDYFDPQIVERTGNQVEAKRDAITAYGGKMGALDDQIAAMEQELRSKTAQIRYKIAQTRLKIESDSIKILQAKIDLQIARRQFNRTDSLYRKGLKSLAEVEDKRVKLQETETKMVAAQNGFETSRNDLQIAIGDLRLTQNEYNNKIAKARSDKFSTRSDQLEADVSMNKLMIAKDNYALRSAFYYILAPQDGYVVKALKPGIGEMLKEGDPVVSIQPAEYDLAVEMYVRPMDLPLLGTGHTVRFLFDGWPSIFFSGWPGVSVGTFGGTIVAMDRNISANGKFRVLVAPKKDEHPWPQALQPGGGAHGIALLKNVSVWYELWRVLNGFPPDLYESSHIIEADKKK